MQDPLPTTGSSRTIQVPILTRVEGEGGLSVRMEGDQVASVQLKIYEPPRFFEALLRGRSYEEVADITSRICGICPIAYQLTAVQALEQAFDAPPIDPQVNRLRKLLYYGEWIESHGLHIHLLHAPDFFDCESGIELAKRFPDEIRRGLQLKKVGNRLLEVIGGRAIHPINVAVGGLHGLPRREELDRLIPEVEQALKAAIETVKWVASFPFPDHVGHYHFVSLTHPQDYAILNGDIHDSSGTRLPVRAYEQAFAEHQVPHSTALHSLRVGSELPYFVGPLARVNLNFDKLGEAARTTARDIGWSVPCQNPYCSIVARALEIVEACEQSLVLLQEYVPPHASRVPVQPKASAGVAATEAPRGLIFHRYAIDSSGAITQAKIVPPTSQNQAQMETDIRQLLPGLVSQDNQQIANQCEKLLRSYDPCISCSTHFLRVQITRENTR